MTCAQRTLRSAWASAQSDLSSLCAFLGYPGGHFWVANDPMLLLLWSDWASFCWYCHVQVLIIIILSCLVFHIWNVGRQCRPRSDAAERGIWTGSILFAYRNFYLGRIKRICVFEHSFMTNFNCACPAIQRDQGSGFLVEGSSWLTACMSEQRRFWRDCADAQARLNLRCSHRR